MNAVARYGAIQNETASRERLMVMLFEAAMKHIRIGANDLDVGRKFDGARAILKASEIVNYLQRTLDHNAAPELCANLASVYTFTCARLLFASATYSAKAAREAEKALAPLCDAFSEAVRLRGAA
jgi:flagellar protein FliS